MLPITTLCDHALTLPQFTTALGTDTFQVLVNQRTPRRCDFRTPYTATLFDTLLLRPGLRCAHILLST
jgi:hypothetical protein